MEVLGEEKMTRQIEQWKERESPGASPVW